MTSDGEEEAAGIPPDDAFRILGDETRMAILRALGEADGPLAFSELYDRVQYDTTANFSYHLEKLEGHFVRKDEGGYTLQEAGKRVVKAVLSGAVTEAPVLEGVEYEERSCPYCDAPLEVGYHHGRVWMSCPDCAGTYGESLAPGDSISPDDHGFLGYLRLPPAGLEGRTGPEAQEAANTWGYLDFLSLAADVCSHCGARVDRSVTVCAEHAPVDGLCDRCDCRHAVQLHTRCTNCIHEEVTPFVLGRLVATTEFMAFLTAHGINPISPDQGSDFYNALLNYEEVVHSVDPFEAEFTISAGGDSITITVDDDLSVVDADHA